jgi:hypothetical protein
MTASSTHCAVHPDQPAAYRCDGCGRALCEACVKPSHRLILCGLCGELAVPLAGGSSSSAAAPRTSTAFRRARARNAPYSIGEVLLYPFRGKGAAVFWSYVALLVLFAVLPIVLPVIGCIVVVPALFVAIMVPRLLFTIVRTTADGDDELPEWPDWDFFARLADCLAMFVMTLIALIPLIVLVYLSGCGDAEALAAGTAPSCFPALAGGFLLGVALWMPTLGATAVFESFWLLPRVDLHVRALLVAPGEAVIMTLLLGGVLIASTFLRYVTLSIPLVGVAASIAIGVYGLFTGAHLVGVYFRRHYDRLEGLYVS